MFPLKLARRQTAITLRLRGGLWCRPPHDVTDRHCHVMGDITSHVGRPAQGDPSEHQVFQGADMLVLAGQAQVLDTDTWIGLPDN